MSEPKATDGMRTPPCPLCSGVSMLKEIWNVETGIHLFFKCVVCDVVYPIITPEEE